MMKKILSALSLLLILVTDLYAAPEYIGTEGKRRVLVEGFSSDGWCGYCPRLHALVKYFDRKHGDDVVCLYYIMGDRGNRFISEVDSHFKVSGYPTMFLERVPYEGVNTDKSYVETEFDSQIQSITQTSGPDFKAYAILNDDKVTFDVLFDEGIPANGYKITYLVLADGLTVQQKNYYSGQDDSSLNYIEEMDYYFAQSQIFSETLDRVAVAASDLNGTPIEGMQAMAELTLPALDEWNISGYHGVIILTDSENKVANVLSIPIKMKPSIRINEYTEEGTEIYPCDTIPLTVTVSPESMIQEAFVWSSDNEEVASVNA